MPVLLVKENSESHSCLIDLLERNNYSVNVVNSYPVARDVISSKKFDLALLSQDLIDGRGVDLIKEIKASHKNQLTPVIFLISNENRETILQALDSGADDYMAQPFDLEILLRKIAIILNRYHVFDAHNRYTKVQNFTLDSFESVIQIGDEKINLTNTELSILKILIANPGHIVSRQILRDRVFGPHYVTPKTLDVHICALRKKISKKLIRIITVRGHGFRIDMND